MKKILVSFCSLFAAASCFAGSQIVNTTVTGGINLSLQSPSSLYTNQLKLQLFNFFSGGLNYGANNGVGVGCANQFFAAQFSLTNGALVGTNWLNLHNSGANGATNSDAVGNAISILNIKAIGIQNLGVGSTNNNETNILYITTPPGAIAWTNGWGGQNLNVAIPGPPANYVANSSNTPAAIFWSGGDVGWPVLAATDNTIVLTNPVPGTVITGNIYIFGSTNQ